MTRAALAAACTVVTATVINAALGTSYAGPTLKTVSSNGVTMTQCGYDPPGTTSNPADVQVIFWSPFTRADFDAARATSESTAGADDDDDPQPGRRGLFPGAARDGAVWGWDGGCALKGREQFELVAQASVDQLVGLAKKAIAQLRTRRARRSPLRGT